MTQVQTRAVGAMAPPEAGGRGTAVSPNEASGAQPGSGVVPGTMLRMTKGLIWLYLILWLFEGTLRKWYLVSLSDVLLIIRDPVVILIYLTAASCRGFRINFFNGAVLVLGIASFVAGTLVLGNPLVAGFGFRANFLHLPLVFVMGAVLTGDDLRKMGKFLLVLALPMALIMAKQYQSGIDDWWNLGARGGRMIVSVGGKIRASGTFSFISGPVAFYGLVCAFFIGFIAYKTWLRWWFALPALAAIILAAAVAGSRSLLLSLIIVGASYGLGAVFFPSALKKFGKWIAAGVVIFLIVSVFDVYKEGLSTTTERFNGATESEGGLLGSLSRLLSPMFITIGTLAELQPLGLGLGLGTNAGAALMGERGKFLLAENEWPRVLLESGPLLGFSYLLLRLGFVLWAIGRGFKAARTGNLFPMALLGAAGLGFLTGQFGQPTSLGAAVLGMGFFVASLSMQKPQEISSPPGTGDGQPDGNGPEDDGLPPPPSEERVSSFVQRGGSVMAASSPFAGLPLRRKAVRSAPRFPVEPPPQDLRPAGLPEVRPGAFTIRSRRKSDEP